MTQSNDNLTDLIALAESAGIQTSPEIFRVLMELLSLQVCPEDIYTLLRQISRVSLQKRKSAPRSSAM
ncbi:uncharacterized protein LOC122506738 [Leptopilina heterotoma]|uniref:uncharacterized protein LOC122506738 n=1 Tax=Leptopilina heterotoma TaxID=63436 RepID=UPI001CA96CC7|nr:uncharacterized protein LOC122506738 [Leptopilina heterotoma]